jgi:hypothetical protein
VIGKSGLESSRWTRLAQGSQEADWRNVLADEVIESGPPMRHGFGLHSDPFRFSRHAQRKSPASFKIEHSARRWWTQSALATYWMFLWIE